VNFAFNTQVASSCANTVIQVSSRRGSSILIVQRLGKCWCRPIVFTIVWWYANGFEAHVLTIYHLTTGILQHSGKHIYIYI
jgi:hypothetical protein